MKINGSSELNGWIFLNKLKEYSELAPNSTMEAFRLEDIVTEIKDKSAVQAINTLAVKVVPTFAPDWDSAEREIKASLDWQSLQIGEPTNVEYIIEEMIAQTSIEETIKWVYDLFLSNSDNSLMSSTLIHALSHMEYEIIYPFGPMMALTMISSIDKRVVGFAVKAFSNWNSKDSLKYINHFRPRDKWAERELDVVVSYIKENGDELNGLSYEKNHATKVDTRTA